jgi:hypothetical protein
MCHLICVAPGNRVRGPPVLGEPTRSNGIHLVLRISICELTGFWCPGDIASYWKCSYRSLRSPRCAQHMTAHPSEPYGGILTRPQWVAGCCAFGMYTTYSCGHVPHQSPCSATQRWDGVGHGACAPSSSAARADTLLPRTTRRLLPPQELTWLPAAGPWTCAEVLAPCCASSWRPVQRLQGGRAGGGPPTPLMCAAAMQRLIRVQHFEPRAPAHATRSSGVLHSSSVDAAQDIVTPTYRGTEAAVTHSTFQQRASLHPIACRMI